MNIRPLHDRVLFGNWSGSGVPIDGIDHLIIRVSDVMDVLDETP